METTSLRPVLSPRSRPPRGGRRTSSPSTSSRPTARCSPPRPRALPDRAGAARGGAGSLPTATGGGRPRCWAVQHRAVLPADLPGGLPAARRPRRHRAGDVAAGGDGLALPAHRRAPRRRRRGRRPGRPPRRRAARAARAWRARRPLGLVAAVGSVVVSALGFVLVKRWPSPTDMLTTISWQLVAGGLVLRAGRAARRGRAARPVRHQPRRPALADHHGHRGRVLLLVPRPGPDARRRRRDRRPRQPGRRHRSSACCSPASCSAGPRRWACCWCSAASSPANGWRSGHSVIRSEASRPPFV